MFLFFFILAKLTLQFFVFAICCKLVHRPFKLMIQNANLSDSLNPIYCVYFIKTGKGRNLENQHLKKNENVTLPIRIRFFKIFDFISLSPWKVDWIVCPSSPTFIHYRGLCNFFSALIATSIIRMKHQRKQLVIFFTWFKKKINH